MVEPTGYTALDIIGFTDKGPYDPAANYVKNDLVHVGNSTWRCKIDDTTGITPTEGANWTIFIESATSLAGMSDVTFTTPTDNDGLVYDSTSQKWENVPITTKEQWQKNGAYNQLNHDIVSQSLNTLMVTVGDDKSITVNGATNGAGYLVSSYLITGIKAGVNYKFIGFPTDLAEYSAYLERKDGGSSVSLGDFVGANTTYRLVVFFSGSFTTGGNPITFKPMITTDLNATYDDYVPYAMTNGELTEKVKTVSYTVNTSSLNIGNYTAFDISSLGIAGYSGYVECLIYVSGGNYISFGSDVVWDPSTMTIIKTYVEGTNLVFYVSSGITFGAGSQIIVVLRKF